MDISRGVMTIERANHPVEKKLKAYEVGGQSENGDAFRVMLCAPSVGQFVQNVINAGATRIAIREIDDISEVA